MDQAEQDQLTRQVGRALLTVAGEGWRQIRAEYRSAGRHIEVDVFVTGPDGTTRTVRPPMDVVDGLGKLRQGMYRPGRGTWLSALYLLDPPSSFSAEFEPDVEPRWRRLPPPIGFADELRFFPRSEEHIPDWLRQRAGLRSAGEPTPPGGTPGGQPGAAGQPGAGPAGARPGGQPDVGSGGRSDPSGGAPAPGQPGGFGQAPGQPGGPVEPRAAHPGAPGGIPQPGHRIPPQTPHPGTPGFPPPQGPRHPGMPPNGESMSFQRSGGTRYPSLRAW